MTGRRQWQHSWESAFLLFNQVFLGAFSWIDLCLEPNNINHNKQQMLEPLFQMCQKIISVESYF